MNEVMRKAMEAKALADQAEAVQDLTKQVKALSSKIDELIDLMSGSKPAAESASKKPKAKA